MLACEEMELFDQPKNNFEVGQTDVETSLKCMAVKIISSDNTIV